MEPNVPKKHTTLQGKILEDSFLNFDRVCSQNRCEFLEFCVSHKLQERRKFTPIFVFPDDKESFYSVEKKSKCELKQIIAEKLAQLEDDTLNAKWVSVRNKKKLDILQFYKDLQAGND
jgi:hypothetical protein